MLNPCLIQPQRLPILTRKLQEGDDSHEISYEDQVVKREGTQENPRSESEVQFDSASISGSKERKIKNDLVDPYDQKVRSPSRLRPPSLPKRHQLKRSIESDSISHGYTSNTEFYPSIRTERIMAKFEPSPR